MKQKLAVVTVCVGDYYEELAKYTHPSLKAYAEKINAEFIVIGKDNPNYITQKYNKFEIYNLLNKYDRIIYLDTDIILRDDCPNLFEVVPKTKLGMYNEAMLGERFSYLRDASEVYQEPLKDWDHKFYNSGVMVISRMHKRVFRLPKMADIIETDQPWINLRIQNDKIEMHDLSYKFNRMSEFDQHIGINRLDSYVIHYAGAPQDQIFPILIKDIETLKQLRGNYNFEQNIAISISAGMGDQLCSEPVVRYIRNEVYPYSNMHVISHHKRLFEHIEGVQVYNYEEWNGLQDAVKVMRTCPDDNESEHHLSHALFHPTDFAAMSTIKMTIPNHKKTIKLEVRDEDIEEINSIYEEEIDFENMVLVHAGRWWPSKTFPIEWWQEIVDELAKKYTIGLIGKTIDEKQGYQDIDCPENGYDFRDRTSLGGLIALISKAKVTLTNDSSPVHIAGAFDNWLVTIPTCKHGDHILPFRNGTQYYKTVAMTKKLTITDQDITPTNFDVETIDLVPSGDIYDYIPTTDSVIDTINLVDLWIEKGCNYESLVSPRIKVRS